MFIWFSLPLHSHKERSFAFLGISADLPKLWSGSSVLLLWEGSDCNGVFTFSVKSAWSTVYKRLWIWFVAVFAIVYVIWTHLIIAQRKSLLFHKRIYSKMILMKIFTSMSAVNVVSVCYMRYTLRLIVHTSVGSCIHLIQLFCAKIEFWNERF